MRDLNLSRASRVELREWTALLPNLIKLVTALMRDRRVPWKHKAVLAGTIAYVVSPIDLIPGVIPGIGQLDDLALLAFGLRVILAEVDQQVILSHWDGDTDLLELVQAIIERSTQWLPQEALDWLGSRHGTPPTVDSSARPGERDS